MITTFQEFEKHKTDRAKWIGAAIAWYMRTPEFKIAQEADCYNRQQNTAVQKFIKKVYDITGVASEDFTSTNNRISSNFFHRLTTQRCNYSLGNGVSFAGQQQKEVVSGETVITDTTKDTLGATFDRKLKEVAGNALRHGRCYCFYNDGDYYVFPMTEFLAFPDETTGKIRAGVRFWSLSWRTAPITVDLYEEDGYSRYRTKEKKYGLGCLEEIEPKRHYKETVQVSEADGEEIVGATDYPSIPIAQMWGNARHQSDLIGMKQDIDAYDLIKSGFANDLTDCAQVYWIVSNAAGMEEDDIRRLRDRLLMQHMAVADTDNSQITPYTQEIPYNARETALNQIREDIYRNYGALDVSTLSASSKTATEINAAYQPMDEEADDFEFQVEEFIHQILALIGIEDTPLFKRNRISNVKEETETVLMAANYLDDRTVLEKLPIVTVDEVDSILARKDKADAKTFSLFNRKPSSSNPPAGGSQSAGDPEEGAAE